MHTLAALLVAEHLDQLRREAATERRARLARGPERSAWSVFADRLTGVLSRLTGRRWAPPIHVAGGTRAAKA